MKLNNGIRGLKKRKTKPLEALREWLRTEEAWDQADIGPAHVSLRAWHKALDRIISGSSAQEAFGANKGGRPTSSSFTRPQRAAIASEHLARSGSSFNKALDAVLSSMTRLGETAPSEREVWAARSALALAAASDDQVDILARGRDVSTEQLKPIDKSGG